MCVQGSFFVTFNDKWPCQVNQCHCLTKLEFIILIAVHYLRLAMELLDQRVKTHLAKTAEYFESMEGSMPSVQERLATLNEASEC